jgi:hypothetical protein
MNKKLIAIAIASVMAAPVAMADVTIDGRMAGEFTNATNDEMTMSDAGQARIGINGTAGNAFARISYKEGLIANIGTTARQKLLGYKFGDSDVRFGIVNSANYALEGDKWKGFFVQMNGKSIVGLNNGAEGGIVQYNGKVAGGKLKVDYNPNGKITANATGSLGASGYFAASFKGKMGNVGYFAGYSNGDGSITSGQSSMKLGASMKFGEVLATAMYSSSDNATTKDTGMMVMADMGLGNGMAVNFGFGTNKANDTQMRLVVSKDLDKGVVAFAGVTSDKTTAATTTVSGAGIMMKF